MFQGLSSFRTSGPLNLQAVYRSVMRLSKMSTNMKWRSFAFVNPIDGLQIIYCFKGMNDVDTVDGHIFCTIFFLPKCCST